MSLFVKLVLPPTLLKTIYEKNFIVAEAKKSMSLAVKNTYILPDLIDALLDGLMAKNLTLAEYSVSYLGESVKNIESSFFF